MTPQHEHDCDRCRFLGRLATADLYICDQTDKFSAIVRLSSRVDDYHSMPVWPNEYDELGNLSALHQDRYIVIKANPCAIMTLVS